MLSAALANPTPSNPTTMLTTTVIVTHTKHDPPCFLKCLDRPYPPGPAQTDIQKGQTQR